MPTPIKLFAANGSEIKVFGTTVLKIDLNLRRPFAWNFIVADVTCPIIGSDFLSNFDLLVDIKRKQLIDGVTSLQTPCTVNKSNIQSIKLITEETKYTALIKKYSSITQLDKIGKVASPTIMHYIETKGKPVYCKARPLHGVKLAAAKKEFDFLLEKGICRPSKSNWSSPLNVVPKGTNQWRPTGDYRALNAITIPERYPLRFITDLTQNLYSKKIFSKIDLVKAYHQVRVNEEDIPKTAIITPFGLFEFLYMPFGLCNAAQTFQRLIDQVLRGLDFTFPYLDDILLFSENEEEHLKHLEIVFQRLLEHHLTVNLSKCELGKEKITFLGHTITKNGITPPIEKIEAIQQIKQPTIAKDLKSFTHMINFYRRFIPHAVKNQMKLQALIVGNKKNDKTPINWTPETIKAFNDCQTELANATYLSFPHKKAELSLSIDASDNAAGAVLHQIINGEKQPLGYFSKKFSSAQQKYSTYDRELTAMYLSLKHFQYVLEGRKFHIWTDGQ